MRLLENAYSLHINPSLIHSDNDPIIVNPTRNAVVTFTLLVSNLRKSRIIGSGPVQATLNIEEVRGGCCCKIEVVLQVLEN
jgi:hypothetical protein